MGQERRACEWDERGGCVSGIIVTLAFCLHDIVYA